MRKLILLALLALPIWAVDPVQTKVCYAATVLSYLDCTFTSTPGANSLIVGFVRGTGGSNMANAWSWSDNKGNTWQEDTHGLLSANSTRGVSQGSGIAATTSATFTVRATPSSAATYFSMLIAEYAGMATTSWRDGTAAFATSGASNGLTGGCGSLTPSGSNTILVTSVGVAATAAESGYSLNSGVTVDASDLAGNLFHSGSIGHKVLTSTATITPVWTWISNNLTWSTTCALYKQSTFATGSAKVARRVIKLRLAALFLLSASAFAGDCTGDSSCYTLALIPDAQAVHSYSTMATWITGRKAAWNIKGTGSGGDIVNDGTGSYANAVAAYKAIATAGIPVFPIPGNHDYCNCSAPAPNNITTRTLPGTVWNNGNAGDAGYFAPDHRSDTHWAYGTDGANYISELAISPTRRLLIVALEFWPRSAAMDWAQTIVLAHPNHEVIVLTHGNIDDVGKRMVQAELYGPGTYGLGGPPASNDAVQMWNGWFVNWPNLRMILNGHMIAADWHPPGSGGIYTASSYFNGRLTANTAGHTVHSLFNNYQNVDGGSPNITGDVFTAADFDHVTFIKFPSAGGYEVYDWATATGVAEGGSAAPMYIGSSYDHINYPAGLWPLPSPRGR